MSRTLILLSLFVVIHASAAVTGDSDKQSAYRVAKLFFAARAGAGEKTSFTDDPTNPSVDKEALLAAVRVSYERTADEKLDVETDPNVKNMWRAINVVIDRARSGEYKNMWKTHPNFPGKLVPARFGNLITAEYNSASPKSKVKWTTADEYLINMHSAADQWEESVIKDKFKSPDWKQGEAYSELVTANGKTTYRFAQPEYFKTACMNCHGGEMGKLIHNGHSAAGSGTFGGLLSVRLDH